MSRFDAIPDELRELDQWICWRTECRECGERLDPTTKICPECGEKATKKPIRPDNRGFASSTDAGTWGTVDEAIKAHQADSPDTDGIGFVFDSDGLLAGIDIDACRDPDSGNVEEWAAEIVDELDSFTEISPSGTGLHVYVYGFIPEGGNKTDYSTGEVEMYDHGRYFTVTGAHLDGTPETVEQRKDDLRGLHRKVFGDVTTTETELEDFDPPKEVDGDFPLHGFPLEELRQADPVLDDLLRESHPGDHDDTSDYDFKTCIRLLHFGYEPKDVHGIMRRYRNRGKLLEDRGDETYLERTIRKAKGRLSGDAKNPVIESNRGDGDKLCFWKLRQSAVAYGILPPDAFIERENEDGDTYLGFPGHETFNRTLEVLEEHGIDHGRKKAAVRATDGGAAAASSVSSPDPSPEPGTDLNPGSIEQRARNWGDLDPDEDIGDLTDPVKAYHTWELIRERAEEHFLAALPDGTIYTYDEGVWIDQGEQRLRELSRRVLRNHYSKNTHSEMCEQVRATDGMDRDLLGTPRRTLAVKNGLLDLERAGTDGLDALRDLMPEDYALTRLPVEFNPDAECPNWREFIQTSVEESRQEAIQEYVGYCLLVGELPIHRAVMLVGGGANGKSTFLRVLKELLGRENVSSKTLQELNQNRFAAADLYGRIANIQADLSPRAIKFAGTFKTHLGGDLVSAEKKHKDPFTFEPTAKHLYSANQVPKVNTDDDAFFRRWLLVEFPIKFTDPGEPGPDKDPELTDRLLEELPGILNWAIEGLDRLLENKRFTNEGDVDAKRDRWVSWGDSKDKFIQDCIETGGDGKYMTKYVYQRYQAYCRQVLGETPDSQRSLTSKLKTLEGVRYSPNYRFDGVKERGFKGIEFTDDAPEMEFDDEEDTDQPDEGQTGLTQYDRVDSVLSIVEQLEGDYDDGVPINAIISHARGLGVDKKTADHEIEQLRQRGELYEVDSGGLRKT